jgi:hypothetical protein
LVLGLVLVQCDPRCKKQTKTSGAGEWTLIVPSTFTDHHPVGGQEL